MSLTLADNGKTFELTPEGTHLARCCKIIDLGTQVIKYNGQPKQAHKVLVGWEIPGELTSEGKPFIAFKRYTASLAEKAILRKDLEAWRGRAFNADELKGFHIGKVLGCFCLINIKHSEREGRTYEDVTSVMSLPKGLATPEPVNDLIFLELDQHTYSHAIFETLSEALQAKIKESPEWKQINGFQYSDESESGQIDFTSEEDIPF